VILGIVPARGGSVGIKRKNTQLVDGKPLVLHAADTLAQVCDRVIVSTDDDLVAAVAGRYEIHRRPTVDASQTILDAVRLVVEDLDWSGSVACLQPTVPQITADDMRYMMAYDSSAQMVYRDRHQQWDPDVGVVRPAANRQDEGDWPFRTVGAFWWPGDIEPTLSAAVLRGPVVDIDSWADLQQVRHKPACIKVWFVANENVGSGHVRRVLSLADALQGHLVVFVPTSDTDMSWVEFVRGQGYACFDPADRDGTALVPTDVYPMPPFPLVHPSTDLVITDTLGVTPHVGQPWISFEDITPDSNHASLVVNALYRDTRPNAVSGKDWVVVRPEYAALPDYEVSKEGESVLVMFGGTDPSRLVNKVTDALPGYIDSKRMTVVRPGEDRPVAELMQTHDLLITSAGRTVYEAALVGIPTIVLAQNSRETTHQHLGFEHGNVNLGLGRLVSDETLGRTVRDVLADYDLRCELSQAEGPDGRGIDRIIHRITGILEGIS